MLSSSRYVCKGVKITGFYRIVDWNWPVWIRCVMHCKESPCNIPAGTFVMTWRFPIRYAIIRIIPITERLWNRCIRLHILKTHFKQNLVFQDKAVWFLRFRLRLSLNRNTAIQMPFGGWMPILICGWFGSSPMQSEKRGRQRFDRLGWAEIREWAFLQLVRRFAPIPSGFLW